MLPVHMSKKEVACTIKDRILSSQLELFKKLLKSSDWLEKFSLPISHFFM